VNRKVIYVALLLHDIAKGRPEDLRSWCQLATAKIAPRSWPSTRQRSTPWNGWCAIIADVRIYGAEPISLTHVRCGTLPRAVQTFKRLDLLCVLTFCDIRGVATEHVEQLEKPVDPWILPPDQSAALETGLEDLKSRRTVAQSLKRLLTCRAAAHWHEQKTFKLKPPRHYPALFAGLHTASQVVSRTSQLRGHSGWC